MKKLLLLLLVLFLFSCEKQVCWECVTIKTDPTSTSLTIPEGFNRILIEEYCDKTEVEIANIEKLGTFRHNLFGIPWNQTTVCTLK